MVDTSLPDLRRKMLQRHGIDFEKNTRRPVVSHDAIPKTPKMKYLEQKYHIRLEVLLFDGSLDDVVCFLGNEVDRSTISKWRKQLEAYS